MSWEIRFDDGAKKDLARLDKQVARRIEDEVLTILVVRIGHRSAVYRCAKGLTHPENSDQNR